MENRYCELKDRPWRKLLWSTDDEGRQPWLPNSQPKWYDLVLMLPSWWFIKAVLLFLGLTVKFKVHPFYAIKGVRDWANKATVYTATFSCTIWWVIILLSIVALLRYFRHAVS